MSTSRYDPILATLDVEGRAALETTVQEILDDAGRDDWERIEAAAALVEDAIIRQQDDESKVVAMMIVASSREHAIRVRHGLN